MNDDQIIDYPVELPPPLRESYDIKHVSPMIRTSLETGRARQRRRYTSVPSIMPVSWKMTDLESRLFEVWFKSGLKDGSLWFWSPLVRTPLGASREICRFTDIYSGPTMVGNPQGHNRWKFTAELEIRERQVLPDDWHLLPDFVLEPDIFDLAINREWPEA